MKIKKIIYSILLFAPILLTGCKDDDVVVVNPAARGTMTDGDGNTYGWVRIGDLDWTTSNAMNGTPCAYATYEGNWGPEDVFGSSEVDYMLDEYIPTYGNLMNYEEAMNCVPEGWRLPTDADWKNLERCLGITNVDDLGWRGDNVAPRLMAKDSDTELNLLLGGGILRRQSYGSLMLDFNFFKEYGYYWSSTLDPNDANGPMAYFRKLVFGVGGVERQSGSTEYLLSVRWCRNAVND